MGTAPKVRDKQLDVDRAWARDELAQAIVKSVYLQAWRSWWKHEIIALRPTVFWRLWLLLEEDTCSNDSTCCSILKACAVTSDNLSQPCLRRRARLIVVERFGYYHTSCSPENISTIERKATGLLDQSRFDVKKWDHRSH